MIGRQTIAYLKILHGSYNVLMISLFLYQGLLGLRIRRERREGVRTPKIIKRHRKSGPVLAVMGVSGFLGGITLVYIDLGQLLKYPLHFFNGLAISLSLITTFIISQRITGINSPWRDKHYMLGILIVCLYFVQLFLGLGILL